MFKLNINNQIIQLNNYFSNIKKSSKTTALKNLLYLYISHLSITNYDIERTDFESWGFQDMANQFNQTDKKRENI
jgi:hypothetical protein